MLARDTRHLTDLVLHLVRRQVDAQHRLTLFGWLWPLVRQLAQLAVLVFLFAKVIDLGIDDYALFVFSGLIAWSWFSSGLADATRSLVANRHLVFTPRFPDLALPLVAAAAPLVDLLLVLPILLVVLALDARLEVEVLLLIPILAAQLVFLSGVGMAAAALNVFFRDTVYIVGIVLLVLFYLTPVFFGLRNVPDRFEWVLELNPMTHFVLAVRAVLFDGALPELTSVLVIAAVAPLTALAGFLLFRRLQPSFVDAL